MPRLIIDNQTITVPEGTRVIEAAAEIGIVIPRFCYHPALGPVGACRVCAVKILEGPPPLTRGVQMSCMITAQDGMVVSTTHPEAVDFRKHIIEFLMMSHPHDCPVCDEGGHCLLQDMTVSGGHGLRRYKGNKRTHVDQDLGPLVSHEMNRCIQCYRCVRYYREFTGYQDLGVMGIGSRVYFGRTENGTLESPFAGNLIDICPTGVYTDRPSRFMGRRWDFERRPGVCIHCGLGCNTVVSSRYREVARQEARLHADINGCFICDRGRYGFYYTQAENRPRQARIQGRGAPVDAAIEKARNLLADVGDGGRIACVGSARSSLETLIALDRLSRKQGWRGPVHWTDPDQAEAVKGALAAMDGAHVPTLQEVGQADFILLAGADPVNEAPMLALSLRQAWKRGAVVGVIDPRPVPLPLSPVHAAIAPHDLSAAVGAVFRQVLSPEKIRDLGPSLQFLLAAAAGSPLMEDAGLVRMAEALKQSRRPLLICGTDIVPPGLPTLAGGLIRAIETQARKPGFFALFPGANAFGAAWLEMKENGVCGGDLESLVSDMASGKIRGLVIVERDLHRDYPDRRRLDAALGRLSALVVLDCLNTEAFGKADVAIPTATLFEAGGTYINNEGRAQSVLPALRAGIPLSRVGGGGHPPRVFRKDAPGGDLPPAWRALLSIGNMDIPPADLLRDADPGLGAMAESGPAEGLRLTIAGIGARGMAGPDDSRPAGRPPDGIHLLFTEQTFGTEELSACSPCLNARAPEPEALLHPDDAARMGIGTGDPLRIQIAPERAIAVRAAVCGGTCPGVIILPRRDDLAGQRAGRRHPVIPRSAVTRGSEPWR